MLNPSKIRYRAESIKNPVSCWIYQKSVAVLNLSKINNRREQKIVFVCCQNYVLYKVQKLNRFLLLCVCVCSDESVCNLQCSAVMDWLYRLLQPVGKNNFPKHDESLAAMLKSIIGFCSAACCNCLCMLGA